MMDFGCDTKQKNKETQNCSFSADKQKECLFLKSEILQVFGITSERSILTVHSTPKICSYKINNFDITLIIRQNSSLQNC